MFMCLTVEPVAAKVSSLAHCIKPTASSFVPHWYCSALLCPVSDNAQTRTDTHLDHTHHCTVIRKSEGSQRPQRQLLASSSVPPHILNRPSTSSFKLLTSD